MNERVKRLSEEIRQLSAEEQADLLDELFVRVHSAPDNAVEIAWTEEAERRLAAYERGETQGEPLRDVMLKLRSRFTGKP